MLRVPSTEFLSMSASIALSDVSLSTPDGRVLCSGINLSFRVERAGLVGRNGIGKTTLLSLIAGRHLPQVGTLSVNGTVAMLRQSVLTKTGETIADLFGAKQKLAVLRRAETGSATAEEVASADWTLEERVAAALARLGLDVAIETELVRLSGGQITRARLAALIFARPDFLLLDEPTNNLDRDGRMAVIDLLSGWRSGAIVVSHDRGLLETMDAIIELTSLGAARYGGNWSQYRERKSIELAAAQHDLAYAMKHLTEIEKKAQDAAESKARKDAGGRRKQAKAAFRGSLPGAARIVAKIQAERARAWPSGGARRL